MKGKKRRKDKESKKDKTSKRKKGEEERKKHVILADPRVFHTHARSARIVDGYILVIQTITTFTSTMVSLELPNRLNLPRAKTQTYRVVKF